MSRPELGSAVNRLRAKSDYIEREGKYERPPARNWNTKNRAICPNGPRTTRSGYWEAADAHERANGRLYREVEFALPRELNERERHGGGLELREASDRRGTAALHAGRCIAAARTGGIPTLT